MSYSFIERIFSIKNSCDGFQKIICIFGIKFKINRKIKRQMDKQYEIVNALVMNSFLANNYMNNISVPFDFDDLLSRVNCVMGCFDADELQHWHMHLNVLFSGKLHPNEFDVEDRVPENIDMTYVWGIMPQLPQSQAIMLGDKLNIPTLIIEDSFLRSACVSTDHAALPKYRSGIAFTIDDLTMYYDAARPSRLELMLNDRDFVITDENKKRARKCINRIIETHLTKYNHQPIFAPNIGRRNAKKVLVVDQKYGDMSISKGFANEKTFKRMLECAVKENPDSDIIVKTHPDTIVGHGGYYTGLKQHGNVYAMTDPINPISLIKYCDKVYVCTTQLGLEALLCGKESHVFGMPFYAGWGLTHDRQKSKRRTNARTIEELFYIVYIAYTCYVNPKTQSRCEIEEAMDYLLELREEYFAIQ